MFTDEQGEIKQEWAKLLEKHWKNYSSAIKEWFKGKNTDIDPKKIAKNYLHSIKRLETFVKRFTGNRKAKFVFVGHSFEIDALLTYLANDGRIDAEGFERIGDRVVDYNELSTIKFDKNGDIHTNYRGQDFVYKQKDKEQSNQ